MLLPLATDLATACRDAEVLFVVNDRLDVAQQSGASGVHLGQDADHAAARRHLGAGRILGVSVGGVDEAVAAERAGADYLGVTVWATETKPEAVPLGPEGLADVVRATSIPVVGIGGIAASNAALVLEAGAAGVAVISAVAGASDPVAAARTLVDVVERFGSVRRAHGI